MELIHGSFPGNVNQVLDLNEFMCESEIVNGINFWYISTTVNRWNKSGTYTDHVGRSCDLGGHVTSKCHSYPGHMH